MGGRPAPRRPGARRDYDLLSPGTPRWKRALRRGTPVVLAAGLLIQLIPYGRRHDNPPVRMEPEWDSQRTRELAVRACFDCHSNQVRWPWYSHVAPLSWLVQRDVDRGRRELNFSEWYHTQKDAREAAEEVEEGKMPPRPYLLTHPEGRLTDVEKSDLIRGLRATIPNSD